MTQGNELQAIADEKRRHAAALLKIQQDFDLGKKRTCPRCKLIFITRKDKRLHRSATHGRCEIVASTVVEELPRHRYA